MASSTYLPSSGEKKIYSFKQFIDYWAYFTSFIKDWGRIITEVLGIVNKFLLHNKWMVDFLFTWKVFDITKFFISYFNPISYLNFYNIFSLLMILYSSSLILYLANSIQSTPDNDSWRYYLQLFTGYSNPEMKTKHFFYVFFVLIVKCSFWAINSYMKFVSYNTYFYLSSSTSKISEPKSNFLETFWSDSMAEKNWTIF